MLLHSVYLNGSTLLVYLLGVIVFLCYSFVTSFYGDFYDVLYLKCNAVFPAESDYSCGGLGTLNSTAPVYFTTTLYRSLHI